MNKKKRIPLNPFVLTGYVSPDYFCDRQKETDKIISALLNGRNITLTSPRRMGKTGLIHHVFHNMQENNDVKCFYVDIYQTDSLELLVKKLADAILGTLDSTEDKIVKNVISFFKMLRPVVTIDPMTGEPGIKVDVERGQGEYSLSEIFAYMEQSEYRCFVAFDEFQTIDRYADKNIEALLRTSKDLRMSTSYSQAVSGIFLKICSFLLQDHFIRVHRLCRLELLTRMHITSSHLKR